MDTRGYFTGVKRLITHFHPVPWFKMTGRKPPRPHTPLRHAQGQLYHLFVYIFQHNQQDATLHNGIYYYKCSKCFRRFLRPSSGAQNCTHSIGYLSNFFCFLPLLWVSWYAVPTHARGKKQKKIDRYPMLCIQFWAPDGGRRNRLKHVEHL
jgi:hypothetical protein